MSDDKLEEIIMDLVSEIDYDIYKSLDPDTAEDPDEARETMGRLVQILREGLDDQG